MVSLNYFSIFLLLVSVCAVFGAANDSSKSNNTDSSNSTKISWYSDKNKESSSSGNTESVQQKSESQHKASGEKVQGTLSDDGKKNTTKETGDREKSTGKGKQEKDLSLEELLKTIEGDKVGQSNPSSTTPDPSEYYSGSYPSSFQYSPYYPEENSYSASYDDYPPIPPPYPYTRYPSPTLSSSPPSHYHQSASTGYTTSKTGNYPSNYYPDEYQPPASWFDPNYYPDETFDDSNNVNNFYSGETYTSEETSDADKRHPKSVSNPLDMVYRLNDPIFLDKPCACSGFGTADDTNVQYKRHAFPPPPFGPKDDGPLKFELPKPQWIAKLKQLHEEKKHKKPEFGPSHVKSRSTDEDASPLPSQFSEEGSGSGFGSLFASQHRNNNEEGESFS